MTKVTLIKGDVADPTMAGHAKRLMMSHGVLLVVWVLNVIAMIVAAAMTVNMINSAADELDKTTQPSTITAGADWDATAAGADWGATAGTSKNSDADLTRGLATFMYPAFLVPPLAGLLVVLVLLWCAKSSIEGNDQCKLQTICICEGCCSVVTVADLIQGFIQIILLAVISSYLKCSEELKEVTADRKKVCDSTSGSLTTITAFIAIAAILKLIGAISCCVSCCSASTAQSALASGDKVFIGPPVKVNVDAQPPVLVGAAVTEATEKVNP